MNFRRVKTSFSVVAALFILVFFCYGQALAATPTEGISLQTSPLPIELTTKPGTSVSSDLRVRNAGTKAEKLAVHLLKVSEDNQGVVHLSAPRASDDWAGWISFDRNVFDAPAGAWQTIKMSINVPKSAAFGYYFAVEYTRANEVGPQPGKATARGAVATFVLLNAEAPGAVRSAEIAAFGADKKTYEFLPVSFAVKIHASGNVHVAPHGNIFILKGGKQVGAIAVNPTENKVLPGGSRFFGAAWSNGFPVYVAKTDANGKPVVDKNGKTKTSLSWDFSHANRLRFGHYTAHLVMVYDDGTRDVPMEATLSFWVVPWRLFIGLLIILLFMGIGLWSSFRKSARFVRRHVKKAKKTDAS